MLERVQHILQDYTDVPMSDITLDSTLVEKLGLNSLDVVNIVVAFEDEFDIEIPDRAIKNLTTVGDIVNYLEKHA